MRNWINLITEKQALNEGVDFYPSQKKVENWDGKPTTVFSYPEGMSRQEMVDCEYCDGSGLDYEYQDDPDAPSWAPGKRKKVLVPGTKCDPCSPPWGDGNGKKKEWVYDFPKMRIPYMGIKLLTDVLGVEYDDSGSFEPEQLPELKRRLMQIINKDAAHYAVDATDEQGAARVDHSGDVPRITRGPRMIGPGVSADAVASGAAEMLKIVDWAQKNGCGVSWA
jgi:hypothetical protein